MLIPNYHHLRHDLEISCCGVPHPVEYLQSPLPDVKLGWCYRVTPRRDMYDIYGSTRKFRTHPQIRVAPIVSRSAVRSIPNSGKMGESAGVSSVKNSTVGSCHGKPWKPPAMLVKASDIDYLGTDIGMSGLSRASCL